MDKKYNAEFTDQVIPVTKHAERAIRAGICFHMELLFSLDLHNPEMNALLTGCGFSEIPVLANAKVYSIKQTTAFLPDEDTIRQYGKAIEESYPCVRSARFIGFRELEMREAAYTENREEDENMPS